MLLENYVRISEKKKRQHHLQFIWPPYMSKTLLNFEIMSKIVAYEIINKNNVSIVSNRADRFKDKKINQNSKIFFKILNELSNFYNNVLPIFRKFFKWYLFLIFVTSQLDDYSKLLCADSCVFLYNCGRKNVNHKHPYLYILVVKNIKY